VSERPRAAAEGDWLRRRSGGGPVPFRPRPSASPAPGNGGQAPIADDDRSQSPSAASRPPHMASQSAGVRRRGPDIIAPRSRRRGAFVVDPTAGFRPTRRGRFSRENPLKDCAPGPRTHPTKLRGSRRDGLPLRAGASSCRSSPCPRPPRARSTRSRILGEFLESRGLKVEGRSMPPLIKKEEDGRKTLRQE